VVQRKISTAACVAVSILGAIGLWWEPAREYLAEARGATVRPQVYSPPLTGPDHDPLPAGAIVRLGRERLRQRSGEALLAFSPDGKILASTTQRGGDGILESYGKNLLSPRAAFGMDVPEKDVIHLWDVASGKAIRRLEGPPQLYLRSIHFSSDGKRLSLLGDTFFSVMDVDTGKEVHRLKGPWDLNEEPRVVASSDGRFLAWRAQHKSPIHVTDTSTGQEVCQLAIEKSELPGAFTDGGKRLVTVSIPNKIVRLREIPTGAEVRQVLPIPGMAGFGIAFSADKSKMLAWQQGAILCWDLSAGRTLRQIESSPFRDAALVALSPDGRTVAAGSWDGKIRLFDTVTGGQFCEIPAHASRLGSLLFSPDNKVLASKEAWDGAIQLWDVATGKKMTSSEGHQAAILSLSVAPDGKTVVTVGADHTLRFWDRATGQELRRFPTCSRAIAFSPDGKTLAAGGVRRKEHRTADLCLMDAVSGKKIRTFVGGSMSFFAKLTFSPDGTMLAGGGDGQLNCLWDVATGKVLGTFPGQEIMSAAFSADSSTLAIGDGEMIKLFGLTRGQDLVELRRFGRPQQPVSHSYGYSSLAFSPDGKFLAAADGVNGMNGFRMPLPRDGVIRIYEPATGQEVRVLKGHHGLVMSVHFSPDSKTLVSGGEDGTVRLWEAATGKQLRCFEGHRDRVTCVNFSPDGRTVISGSCDSTALVWNVTLP
jgi:WD40 repeat protein